MRFVSKSKEELERTKQRLGIVYRGREGVGRGGEGEGGRERWGGGEG